MQASIHQAGGAQGPFPSAVNGTGFSHSITKVPSELSAHQLSLQRQQQQQQQQQQHYRQLSHHVVTAQQGQKLQLQQLEQQLEVHREQPSLHSNLIDSLPAGAVAAATVAAWALAAFAAARVSAAIELGRRPVLVGLSAGVHAAAFAAHNFRNIDIGGTAAPLPLSARSPTILARPIVPVAAGLATFLGFLAAHGPAWSALTAVLCAAEGAAAGAAVQGLARPLSRAVRIAEKEREGRFGPAPSDP
ncbi:hypothetical protein HK405_013713, partial [Cladochytrium tenue]